MHAFLPLEIIPANPLNWSSATFFGLILACLLVRKMIPPTEHDVVQLVREALFIAPAILFYFWVRGLVQGSEGVATANAKDVIGFEKAVGLFHELWLQAHLLTSDWAINLVNWVYIWAHWPVLIGGTIWLASFHRDHYPTYRSAFLLSGAVGMVIFLLYPVAPPRFMDGYGFVDTVTMRSDSYRVLQPPALANLYAAMPSLHFGWNLLMGVAIYRETRHLGGKIFALVMPPAMFLAVVVTANHFILDAIVGGTLVLACLWAVIVGQRYLAARREADLRLDESATIVHRVDHREPGREENAFGDDGGASG